MKKERIIQEMFLVGENHLFKIEREDSLKHLRVKVKVIIKSHILISLKAAYQNKVLYKIHYSLVAIIVKLHIYDLNVLMYRFNY
jgi:hypothetical protein